jgi:5,10-methylenetetrahydromethanopterin reductase
MEFGIALVSNVDAWKTAKRAEELGFSHCWFFDSQLLCPDIYVSMALAAANTSRIKLGTGVIVPSNRLAPVTANALASLNRLAPGRIVFGVGTGFTARNTMGLRPYKLSQMKEYVEVVQALLRGETVEAPLDGERKKIRFLNPEIGLINLDDPIPLHFSAFAPKAQELTARVGDGWMTFMAAVDNALADAARIDDACRRVGREPKTMYKTAFALGCVLDPGEAADSERAIAEAGPAAAVFLHAAIEGTLDAVLPAPLRALLGEYRKQVETYEPADARYLTLHKGHLIFVRPEERRFLTADFMRGSTFTGTEGELLDGLRQLRDAGYDQFTIQLVNRHESAIERWAKLFEKV